MKNATEKEKKIKGTTCTKPSHMVSPLLRLNQLEDIEGLGRFIIIMFFPS